MREPKRRTDSSIMSTSDCVTVAMSCGTPGAYWSSHGRLSKTDMTRILPARPESAHPNAQLAGELLANDREEAVDVVLGRVEGAHPAHLAARAIPVVEAHALADPVGHS